MLRISPKETVLSPQVIAGKPCRGEQREMQAHKTPFLHIHILVCTFEFTAWASLRLFGAFACWIILIGLCHPVYETLMMCAAFSFCTVWSVDPHKGNWLWSCLGRTWSSRTTFLTVPQSGPPRSGRCSVKSMDSGTRLLGFRSPLCHLLAAWPQTSM